jgi:hypothetical protein
MTTANFPIDNLSDGCAALVMDLTRADIRVISDRKDNGKPRLMILSPAKVTPEMNARLKTHCEELCGAIERGLK